MARAIQVNSTDYDGRIVIEESRISGYDGFGRGLYDWSVPAWEEIGMGDLEGDLPEYTEHNGERFLIGWSWSSVEAAQAALDAHRAIAA